jgi:hypothetical protein
METQGRTFAKRLNVRRNVKFNDTCPLPTATPKVNTMKYMTPVETDWELQVVLHMKVSLTIHNTTRLDAPLRATVFFFTDWIADSGMTVLPPFSTGETLTSSHWTGTCVP